MPENRETQTQPNNTGYANPAGEPSIDPNRPQAQGEDRSFRERPSDTEAAHDSEEGDSVRSRPEGAIGGDMGRDPAKGQQGLKPTEPGGEMEHQDPRHMDDLARVQGDADGASANDRGSMEAEGHAGSSYDPSDVESTRARMQGGGVGQRDMDRQSDPTRADSSEHYGQMQADDGRRGEGGTDVEGGESRKGGVEQI